MSPELVVVGVGWADGTIKSPAEDEAVAIMRDRFGEPFDAPPSGFYGRAAGFDGGRARVEWMGRSDAAGTTRVEVKQSAFDGLGLAGSVGLFRVLDGAGFRASRVDVWADDYGRRITPERVRDAVRADQVVTHARPGRHWIDELTGEQTYYLGRPSSDRRTRTYDKPDPFRTRHELQTRRDFAAHVFGSLVQAEDPELVPVALGQLVSFADFRLSRVRTHGSRRPRLDWWEAVVGDVARAEAAPSRPRPSIEEVAAYFRRCWSRRLAELWLTLGDDWLNETLRAGMGRIDEDEEDRWVA